MRLPVFGFIGAVAILAAVTLRAYQSADSIEDENEWVIHTHIVLENIERMHTALARAELADATSPATDRHRATTAALESLADNLRRLTADNAEQQQHLALLATALTDSTAASHAVADATLEEMKHAEKLLLRQRDLTSRAAAAATRTTVLVGSGMTVSLLLVVFGILMRESRRRRASELDALASRSLLHAAINGTNDPFYVKDLDGRFVMLNAATADNLGRAQTEIIGRTSGELYGEAAAQPIGEHDAQVIAQDRTMTFEETHERRGLSRVFLVSKGPHRDATGRVTGVIAVAHDITERKHLEEERQRTNLKLEALVVKLEQRGHEIAFLSELGRVLQTAVNHDEAAEIMAAFAQKLFAGLSGSISVTAASRDHVIVMASWGGENPTPAFAPTDCWAIRGGKPHPFTGSGEKLVCRHFAANELAGGICVPLAAQGETLGVVHLYRSATAPDTDVEMPWTSENALQLTLAFSETIALALANLQLRESLRNQALRDALTGLFNRRYMQESLVRELRRATRAKSSIGVVMVDIDHFKRFNDEHGHEAGDEMLRATAACLARSVRGEDIVCRYGGEELTVILPDSSLEDTRRRAEQLRTAVAQLQVLHHGRSLGSVTLSMGVAAFPTHGEKADDLLRAADIALYVAKRAGRDRVAVAEVLPTDTGAPG